MPTVERTTGQAIDELEALYEFREPDAVRAYLVANPDLLPLLREAANRIPEFLTPDGSLVLEFFANPEEEDDTAIFAIVPTRHKHDEVRPRLNRLTRDWLVEAARGTGSRFNVDVEFR